MLEGFFNIRSVKRTEKEEAFAATERNLVKARLPSERNGSAAISRGGQYEIEISFDSSTFADCDCGNQMCYWKHKVGRHWPIPSHR